VPVTYTGRKMAFRIVNFDRGRGDQGTEPEWGEADINIGAGLGDLTREKSSVVAGEGINQPAAKGEREEKKGGTGVVPGCGGP